MGAKQSKRSVDISGKEAEGAGEVAAAGAGGEGRVEQLADADALKPQLNGDAHIHEQTEKEKQLDIGTPENEKDATTEKEAKQDESAKEEKEETPITNGENGEAKPENSDSTPTSEDSKKPKKEKVKKKWSLRSISFSRKDKPKQEKKQKEEEPKTNGEPEKVPEEAAEVTAESVNNEITEVKTEEENKDEKTPETPVTEPITNGSNTPDSPQEEIPPVEKGEVPVTSPEEKAEVKVVPEPEQLPVNGLSLEEPKSVAPEVVQIEESKPEEPAAESPETVPAIDIPVKKEVCVEQMPLIESTPPPLPANPPPSSVASFAATTMAPDLTDASLANTAETAISTPPAAVLDTKTNIPNESLTESQTAQITTEIVTEVVTKITEEVTVDNSKIEKPESPVTVVENQSDLEVQNIDVFESTGGPTVIEPPTEQVQDVVKQELAKSASSVEAPLDIETPEQEPTSEPIEDFPPPPPPADDELVTKTEVTVENIEPVLQQDNDIALDENYTNGNATDTVETEKPNENGETVTDAKNKIKDALDNVIERVECNGNAEEEINSKEETAGQEPSEEESLPPSPEEPAGAPELADALPAPPADLRAPATPSPPPQEPLPVSDKIADLIPEVPVVPELKTETESSELAVATN